MSYGNVKIDLIKDKSKQLQAVKVVEFFDNNLKCKRFALTYFLLNEIKKFKMTFKKDNTVRDDIGIYIVRMFVRNDKEYLEKEIFLNKKNVEYSMIAANNVKSTIFFEYRKWIIPISLNITVRYFDSLVKKEKKQDFHEWLYNFVFPRRDTTQQYGFTRDKTQFDNSSAFPFYLTDKTLTFQGGVKYYLSLEMYAKGNDSLIKKITEKGAFHVDPNRLKFLRCYLPIWYTASTLYEFTSASDVALYLEKKYFVLPDFNIDVKIKGRSSPIVKNVIESFFSLVDIARKIGRSGSKTATIVVDSLKSDSNKKLEEVRALWNKVNLKSITNVYENFFLYDLERIIQPKFVTELEKDFSIYGLISYSGENKEDNKLDLIKPTDSLKFQLLKDFYKNSLFFELGKAHEDRSFTVVGNRVFNLGLLRTRKHKPIGEKRPMTLEVIDTIRVLGVQDQNVNFINTLFRLVQTS